MEIVQHFIGSCGDNHSHFDLSDLALAGGGAMGLYTLKYYLKGMYLIFKNYLKTKYNEFIQ
jgi:hypothetical protein